VVEDVLVKVEIFYYPADFFVLDNIPTLHPSANIPIILGRPFLAIANFLINCRNGRMKITFGCMTAELNIFNVNQQHLVDDGFKNRTGPAGSTGSTGDRCLIRSGSLSKSEK
jgi:hypothetical protein